MYDEPFIIIIIVLVALCAGGAINRQSDVGITITEAFHTIRQDLSTAVKELWISFKDAFYYLCNTVTFVKVIELSFLGLLLKSLPELMNFVFKTLDKTAKV
jgi:hypothetical protein